MESDSAASMVKHGHHKTAHLAEGPHNRSDDEEDEDSNHSEMLISSSSLHQLGETNGANNDSPLLSSSPKVHDKHRNRPGKHKKPQPTLRYRRTALVLYVIYFTLTVVPWVLTCVLAVRPTSASSYYQQSLGLQPKVIENILETYIAIRVLNSIAGVITVPLIGAILAQAAVLHTQRRRSDQKFSLGQTFTLADRAWNDYFALWSIVFGKRGSAGSRFLLHASALLLLGSILQPLQSLLVQQSTMTVMTCLDGPIFSCDPLNFPKVVAYDPDPADLAILPQEVIVQLAANSISTASLNDFDPRIWRDSAVDHDPLEALDVAATQSLFYYLYPGVQEHGYFVAAVPNGVTTGVFREHAIRLNHTVSCTQDAVETFPSACPGELPFTTSFSSTYFNMSVCAPGRYGASPWTLSRNSQNITEDLYLLVSSSFDPLDSDGPMDEPAQYAYSVHCQANTTRGYFELGNYRNNYTYGPLLASWPSPEEMATDFNDYLGFNSPSGSVPSESDPLYNIILDTPRAPDPFEGYAWQNGSEYTMAWPLMTVALSVFGNQSFFFVASNSSGDANPAGLLQLCMRRDLPFFRLSDLFISLYTWALNCENAFYSTQNGTEAAELDRVLVRFVRDWAFLFSDTTIAANLLDAAMSLVNREMLTATTASSILEGARSIYSSPGTTLPVPMKTLAGTIIITVLMAIELGGLAYAVFYTQRFPTWTTSLDAIAIARIGAGTKDVDLLPLGPADEKLRNQLKKADGLIGVTEKDEHDSVEDANDEIAGNEAIDANEATKARTSIGLMDVPAESRLRLELGGPGLIKRDLVKKTRSAAWKKEWWKRKKNKNRVKVKEEGSESVV